MGEIVRMIVVLSLICGTSGLVLSTLKDVTREPIEQQVLTYIQGPAIDLVLTAHENDPIADRKTFALPDGAEVTVFPAMKNGKLASVAIETAGQGYGGDVGIMTGFNTATDQVTGIGVTTMKETPGIGSRIQEHGFTEQFKGHGLANLALASKGGDIDGVSGASYSSAGAVAAVAKAAKTYEALKGDFAKTWGN